jgi:hypothetical protein
VQTEEGSQGFLIIPVQRKFEIMHLPGFNRGVLIVKRMAMR